MNGKLPMYGMKIFNLFVAENGHVHNTEMYADLHCTNIQHSTAFSVC
jgi:hypothetical protein